MDKHKSVILIGGVKIMYEITNHSITNIQVVIYIFIKTIATKYER